LGVCSDGEPQVEQRLLRFGREMGACPGLAAVDGVQDGLVMAYGPTVLRVHEEHRREHRARRHRLRLAPRGPLVVRQQHVAAFTHRDQARAGDRQIEQQGIGDQRFDLRRLVGRIVGIELGMRDARGDSHRPQHRDQREAHPMPHPTPNSFFVLF
jgi:hypothetical protein